VTPNGIGATPTTSGSYPGRPAAKAASGTVGATSPGTATSSGSGPAAVSAGDGTSPTSGSQTVSASAGSTATTAPPPALVSAELPRFGSWSMFAKWTPVVVVLLLLVFALPAVIGYRRSRWRREVER